MYQDNEIGCFFQNWQKAPMFSSCFWHVPMLITGLRTWIVP